MNNLILDSRREMSQKFKATCSKCKSVYHTYMGQTKYCSHDATELTLEPVVDCILCGSIWVEKEEFHNQKLCKEHLTFAKKIETVISADDHKVNA